MAINLTLNNIAVLAGLLVGLLVAMFSGTAAMMEWRIDAVQSQLRDRMMLYERENNQLIKRLERLENK